MGVARGVRQISHMKIDSVNIVPLLCDLSEASDDVFRDPEMALGIYNGLRHLAEMGAIERGPRPETVACTACDADHPAVIEYDPIQQCYVHFCPEAGLVTLNDADLITHRFRPEWLVDWLVQEVPITSPVRRPALVDGRVWHLGDASCGDVLVTAIFARRVSSQAELDHLMSALRPIHPVGKGLVLTTSPHVARQIQLPNGFEFLELADIIRSVGDRLIVDQAKLGSRVQGLLGKSMPAKPPVRASQKNRKEPSRLDYREADKLLIAEMHAMILAGDARNATDAARALAKRAAGSGREASKVTRLAAGYIKMHPNG
jgi:hypothetical protein